MQIGERLSFSCGEAHQMQAKNLHDKILVMKLGMKEKVKKAITLNSTYMLHDTADSVYYEHQILLLHHLHHKSLVISLSTHHQKDAQGFHTCHICALLKEYQSFCRSCTQAGHFLHGCEKKKVLLE